LEAPAAGHRRRVESPSRGAPFGVPEPGPAIPIARTPLGHCRAKTAGKQLEPIGPLENNEHWPWFSVAHPDEPDYHPPADAVLQTWLAEHYLLPGQVVGTLTIAGETALHTRIDNGPQAYDDDRFYFVHGGQVYEIVIMHAGKEDWAVYDVFLDSFAFQS